MHSPGISHCRPCWLLVALTAVVGATAPSGHQQPALTDARTHHQRLARLPLRAAFARRQRGSKSDLSIFADGSVDYLNRFRGGGDNGSEDEAPPTTSANVEAPVEVDDTTTSIAEEADDKKDGNPADAGQSDDASKGEKLAYSLSGITRKVNNEDNEEDEARSSAVPDDTAESAGDSEVPSVDEDGIATAPTSEDDVVNSSNVSTDEPDDDATFAAGSDDTTSKPLSPLADLSNQLHEILIRHRMHFEEESKEVTKLRDLILERCEEYMDDIQLHATGGSKKKPRHPRKLLHFLAPKIPAIKQSPDITLRIKSAKADLDGSVAAFAIGSIACMTELFDQHTSTLESQDSEEGKSKDEEDEKEEDAGKSDSLASGDIVSDRRLEQLTECVLSSVDAKAILQKIDRKDDDNNSADKTPASLDPTDSLSVQDAAYAAFGLALLGARDLGKLGGYKPSEVFSILSLHCRDVLLAKETQMKSRDSEAIQDVVHDVATALWAFSCVKSICGYRSDDLFDTCCSILLLQESDLKQNVAEADELGDEEVESGDSAAGNSTIESETIANVTDVKATDHISPITIESSVLNRLGHRELVNSLWALAIHGSSDNRALHWAEDTSSSSQPSSETPEVLADLLMERVGCLLGDEIGRLSGEGEKEDQGGDSSSANSVDNQSSDSEQDSDPDTETGDSFNDNQGNSTSINGVQEMLCDDKGAGDSAPGDGEVIQVISAAAILEEEARQRQDDAKSSKQKKKSAKKNNNNEEVTAPEASKEEEEIPELQNDTDDSTNGAQKEEQAALAEETNENTPSPPQSTICAALHGQQQSLAATRALISCGESPSSFATAARMLPPSVGRRYPTSLGQLPRI